MGRVLLTILFVGCCLSMTGYGLFVKKTSYDSVVATNNTLERQLADTHAELQKAKEQIAEMQAHKYQTFRDDGRTWRLDTVSGDACLLLATDADWKGKFKDSGCN